MSYTTASGEDVQRVADKINVALEGETDQLKMMGTIAYCLLVAAPGIPANVLSEGVQSMSEAIAFFLMDQMNKQNNTIVVPN